MAKYLILVAIASANFPETHALNLGSRPCMESGTESAFKNLINKVAIINEDSRYKLSAYNNEANPPPDMKLSTEEINQIRGATGFVSCKFTRSAKDSLSHKDEVAYATSSAQLVGDNAHLLMSGHGLYDKVTKQPIPSLSGCVFVNHENPPQKIAFAAKDVRQKGLVKFNKDYDRTSLDEYNDYAFVKLKGPLAGTKPFPVDISEKKLKKGDHLLTISAYAKDMPADRVDLTQPVAQFCHVRDTDYHSPQTVYTDCDIEDGQSGSMQLIRDGAGRLVMRTMMVASAPSQDGMDYDFSRGNFTISAGIDGEMIKDLKAVYPQLSDGNGAVEAR